MQILSHIDQQTILILIAILALILGSFASLLSYRLSKKQPIVFARSKCTNCGISLKAFNLIPLFSWIFQAGKCTNCKIKISPRYPLIELSFLISFLVIYFTLNQELNLKMIIYFLITFVLIMMIITDLEEYLIPDILQYLLTIFVTFLLVLQGGSNAVIANISAAFLYIGFGLILYGFFYITTKVEAIGIDDLKFFFIAGLMLGNKNFLAFMLLSGIFGAVFGSLWQKIKKEKTFPFAPAICLSAFLCLLLDQKLNPVNMIGSMLFYGF